MPRSCACAGEVMVTGLPSNVTCPSSGGYTPAMVLTRVDLPAPLSPTRATTSPASTLNSMSLRAWTAPKRLDTPVIDSTGAEVVVMLCSLLREGGAGCAGYGGQLRPALAHASAYSGVQMSATVK